MWEQQLRNQERRGGWAGSNELLGKCPGRHECCPRHATKTNNSFAHSTRKCNGNIRLRSNVANSFVLVYDQRKAGTATELSNRLTAQTPQEAISRILAVRNHSETVTGWKAAWPHRSITHRSIPNWVPEIDFWSRFVSKSRQLNRNRGKTFY
jgi:hypothetical protein